MKRHWAPALTSLVVFAAGCWGHARRDAPSAPPSKVASDMVAIPPGTFTMGDRNGEPDEYPERTITMPGFKMEKTEVSNAAYRACVEAKACDPARDAADPELGKDDHPVVGVSWDDAVRYCAWVKRRLPTEAEWEYAARGTDLRKWPWSGAFDNDRANIRVTGVTEKKTAPVNSFPKGASPFGVLNMAGNVSEWVADYYDPTWYRTTEKPNDPRGPDRGRERAIRGGSYADPQHIARVSARRAKVPTEVDSALGFRCAADE